MEEIWIGWYFVVAAVGWFLADIAVIGAIIINPHKVFVNHTGFMKSCFHVTGCHFSECLFTFYLNLIFFLENPPRKLKTVNFFLSFFSAPFWKSHDWSCSFLKSGAIFCPRGNFNLGPSEKFHICLLIVFSKTLLWIIYGEIII